jgi:predicted dehydrogenase/nucleoside-diphosphate-sugar epimerase
MTGFRVGILGAGYVADYHLRALKRIAGLDIVGIADPDLDKAKTMAARYGIPLACATLEELTPARPNVIHVLTPPRFHADLSIAALKMGCHVYVEKPMAETAADCDRMIEAAKQQGRVLSVNHSARMDPIVLEAVRLVQAGRIGDVVAVDFFRSSDYIPYAGGPSIPAPFRSGSYPFQDLGVHALYLLETFLGEIGRVEARFYSTGREPFLTFDEWRVLAECRKGVGQIYLSWNVNPMQNELVIHGTKGVIHADCYVQYLTVRRKLPMIPKPIQRMGFVMANGLSGAAAMVKNFVRIATGRLKGNPGIQVAVEKFYEALRVGQPPPIPASEGRRMVKLMEEVSAEADAAKEARQQAERSRAVPPARVLVTGAGGFLGGALVRRLAQSGEPIRVLVRRPAAWLDALPNVHAVYGDLGDAEAVDRAVAGVQTVYHAGAAMRGGKEEFERATVWGTRNMIDSCLRHGIQRMVYVSSLTVLDQAGHKPGTPVTESSPLEPHPGRRGLYTQTKLAAEAIVLDAVANRGLPAAIIRPGQIFGPGAERTSPAGAIGLAGRWVVVGSGKHKLPLVYVEDVVDGLIQAATRPEALGAVIQLVDPTPVTQKEFVNICRRSQVLRPPIKSLYIPKWFMKLASWGVDKLGKLLKRDLPLSPYRVDSLRPPSPFDITAARTRLGWEPRVGTRQGLEITIINIERS